MAIRNDYTKWLNQLPLSSTEAVSPHVIFTYASLSLSCETQYIKRTSLLFMDQRTIILKYNGCGELKSCLQSEHLLHQNLSSQQRLSFGTEEKKEHFLPFAQRDPK